MTNASIIDRTTALHATIGALAALHRRDVTGEGQSLDVCLLDSAYTLMEIPIAQYLLGGKEPQRNGNRAGGISPANTYRAKDGWVYLLAIPQDMFGKFCRAIGREDLLTDPRFVSIAARGAHSQDLDTLVADWVREKTVAEVVTTLERAEVPVAPVHSIPQAAHDPHLWERKMLVEADDPESGRTFVPGLTVKFSATPGAVGAIPRPGQHNNEIYCGLLGRSPDELTRWKEERVI
jgi:formyl-CoA transferase